MRCSIEYKRKAKKFLENYPRDIVERVKTRLKELSENPVCEEELERPLQELCKTRVGSYRIAYLVKPCNIVVVDIR
uniref:Type II toxin-antitoxin system RelE/ParE family toxin n=1 Tax=Ignisphaera aggregans TaxID=334771 RepID=A0A7C4FGT4_9CREN